MFGSRGHLTPVGVFSVPNQQDIQIMSKFLTFVAVLFLAVTTSFAGEYPDISIAELKTAIAAGKVTLVDVNGSESWQKAHIPGAVDFDKSKGEFKKSLPTDKKALVVAYCGGPKCNAYQAAAKAAAKLGYKNVKHLSAGISGWKDAGEKTEKGS